MLRLTKSIVVETGFQWANVGAAITEDGIVLIDDVRCGFRLKLSGSARFYGYEADLSCFGKAMANGYPIAVATGRTELKAAAEKVYFTGTHFFSGVPFAAAIATIDEIQDSGAIEKIDRMGRLLLKGLQEAADAVGVKIRLTGPPAMPFMAFVNDPAFEKNRFFCGQAARRGIFFHPHHNWFICAAITEADICRTIEVAHECFKLTQEKFS